MTKMNPLNAWLGKIELQHDDMALTPARALAMTLDRDDPPASPGDALPPLWHWLHFLPLHRQAELGPDGHGVRGGFLPPVDLPRRMWAGGSLRFLRPLCLGEPAIRTSRIADISEKQGRSGRLVFVRVQHEIAQHDETVLIEQQDLVFREAPAAGAPTVAAPAAPAEPQFSRRIVPDPVLLFRYSALTFNGHRIHYDQPYATAVEGYPGLVVHGPLIATLLADLLRRHRPQARLTGFSFKAVSPLFDTAPFSLHGRLAADERSASLWAATPDGRLAMQASAELD